MPPRRVGTGAVQFNWPHGNLARTVKVHVGVINLCSNPVKYAAQLLCVRGSCETAFRFVICLHSLCLGKLKGSESKCINRLQRAE